MPNKYLGLGILILSLFISSPASSQPQASPTPERTYDKVMEERIHNDWPFLGKFRSANSALPPAPKDQNRVVFMGDSITESWGQSGESPLPGHPPFFPGLPYVNRGISGQTTPQMLVRFRQDVIALNPRVVVLLGGINDIAENTGKTTLSAIEDNIASMCELAHAHGIRVVLCSLLPTNKIHWKPAIQPVPQVRALNTWLREYAAQNGHVFVDYFSNMVDDHDGIRAELTKDGLHPNLAGYQVMLPLVQAGIQQAIR